MACKIVSKKGIIKLTKHGVNASVISFVIFPNVFFIPVSCDEKAARNE